MSYDSPNSGDASRPRRGSVTSAAFTNLFQRSNSMSQGTPAFPGAITTAAIGDPRRRLSISTIGLSGTSPTAAVSAFSMRRGSNSTNSDLIDENAVDEDDVARIAPTTPFTRRMSFGTQAMRTYRTGGGSPGSSSDQGFNWSEQLRSRAESISAGGGRPSFAPLSVGAVTASLSSSPPRAAAAHGGAGRVASSSSSSHQHDRAKSTSDMPQPPSAASTAKARHDPRPKPDHFQERILKGDFYMD